jgi:hypothetical protein
MLVLGPFNAIYKAIAYLTKMNLIFMKNHEKALLKNKFL